MADVELSLPVNLRAVMQDLPAIAAKGLSRTLDEAVCGALCFWGHATTVVTGMSGVVSSVSKSPDALKNTLSSVVSLVDASKFFKPISISQGAVKVFSTVENFISVTKIVQSTDYFVNAKFLKDLDKGKPFGVVAEVCFAAARVGVVALWAAQLQLVNLGMVTNAVAKIPVFGQMILKAGMMPAIEILFIGGIVGCIIEDARVLLRGEEIAYRIVDLVNLVAEGAILGCLVVGGFNPIVLGVLGVIAGGTGVAAFLLEPLPEKGATDNHSVAMGIASAGGSSVSAPGGASVAGAAV